MKKGGKPPPQKKGGEEKLESEEMTIDESEEATVELVETLPEPECEVVSGSEKNVPLKSSITTDYARYECEIKKIDFKPTLMFATRSYKFMLKNTSLIALNYNFKIVSAQSGLPDAGPYSIIPHKGSIAPGCDESFIVKFSPVEVEQEFERLLSGNISNRAPDCEALIIELTGIAERPICHFELPPSTYKEKKAKDMTPIDSKYNIIEFESLGTKVKNTKRFMVVNPTS